MTWLVVLAFLVLAAPLAIALSRANEVFVLRVRAGRLAVVRGRIPQRLVDDLADVVRRAPDTTLRCVSEGGRPRLIVDRRVPSEVAQRMRNVVGTWTLGQLRTAPRPR